MINSNCSVIGEKVLTWESCVRQKQLLDLCPRPGGKNSGHAIANHSTGGASGRTGSVLVNSSTSEGFTGLTGDVLVNNGTGLAGPDQLSGQGKSKLRYVTDEV